MVNKCFMKGVDFPIIFPLCWESDTIIICKMIIIQLHMNMKELCFVQQVIKIIIINIVIFMVSKFLYKLSALPHCISGCSQPYMMSIKSNYESVSLVMLHLSFHFRSFYVVIAVTVSFEAFMNTVEKLLSTYEHTTISCGTRTSSECGIVCINLTYFLTLRI